MTELQFENTIKAYGIESAMKCADIIYIGFSGGADSSCLLHVMSEWCKRAGKKLEALHMNHMIRGKEAQRDEEFCRKICDGLGIILNVYSFDVPGYAAENGYGMEEAARRARYGWFEKTIESSRAEGKTALIATAHNADDNLETVIFNMMRGSGTKGLSGISPLRDGKYVRPLIGDTSENIRKWCNENGVDYVIDSTNSDDAYTRNRIRHVVIPELRNIFEKPEKSVQRLGNLLRMDDDYLNSVAVRETGAGSCTVPREKIKGLHRAVASRIIRYLYANAAGTTNNLGESNIADSLELICSEKTEGMISLPGGLILHVDRNNVTVGAVVERAEQNDGFLYEYTGEKNEKYETKDYELNFYLENSREEEKKIDVEKNIYKLSTLTVLNFDKIKGTLKVRCRQPGDEYRFGGMTRKLKNLFINKKMTKDEKEHIPIVCDDEGIVWIPGFPPRDGAKHTGKGQKLILEFTSRT